jgi:uncharacterized damage-inducible protein DinB
MDATILAEYWDRVRRGTLATLDKFEDDELSWRPWEGGRTIREIWLHIAHEEEIEIAHGAARAVLELPEAFRSQDYLSKRAIRDLLVGVHARTMQYLGTLEAGALMGDVELAWGETSRLFDVVMHVIEHEIHHRGELSLSLGLLGREGLDA